MAEFTIECFQNEYLPVGGDLMHAIVTVSASGAGVAGTTPGSDGGEGRAELIIVDTSGRHKQEASLFEEMVQVQEAVMSVPGVIDCEVETVWDPPWDPSRMTEEARLQLNMF